MNDLININDFKRELVLSLSGQSLEDLRDFIESEGKKTVSDIFTDSDAFINEIKSETPDSDYLEVWEVLKEACLYFIYCDFLNFLGSMRKSGKYQDVISNSELMDSYSSNTEINIKYNKGVTLFNKSIQIAAKNKLNPQPKYKTQRCVI